MSWKKVKLGELITESRIPCENPNTDRRIKVRLKVLGVEKRGLENEIEGATKQFIRKAGQFIYGKQNFHKGAFGIIPKELDGFESSADLPAFDVSKECLPEWIFYFFKQGNYYLQLSKIARGVATQRIHPEQIYDLEIPLPDIKTQKEFLANIYSIENKGGELSTELTHQQDLLKQLRQSFLEEAMQGKLVKQDKKDGNAAVLLEKIKIERAKSGKKEKVLLPIKEDEIPFDIPENWVWCKLGEICKVKVGSTPSRGVPKFWNGNIPWVSSGEVANNFIYDTEEKISQEGFDNTSLVMYPKGSVLVAMIGQGKTRGQTSILKIDATTNQNVAGLIIEHQFLLSEFLWFFFLSRYEITRGGASGGNQPALNGIKISNTIFPLPPLAEQKRIVKKLEEVMNLCEELKTTITDNQNYTNQLLQVALKDALQMKQEVAA